MKYIIGLFVILFLAVLYFAFIYPIWEKFKNIAENGINNTVQNTENENASYTYNKSSAYFSSNTTFGEWSEYTHNSYEQQKRISRANSYSMTPSKIDRINETAQFYGSKGIYETTLNYCTCPDFQDRHLPCKHIYKLAIDLGKFTPPSSTYGTNSFNSTTVSTYSFSIPERTPEEKREWSLIVEFEEENKSELRKWERKLDNFKTYENPNNTLKFYKKLIDDNKLFKDYCYSFGESGELWYEKYHENDVYNAEDDYEDYLNNHYEQEVADYQENLRIKKLRSEIESTVLKLASSEAGVLQKDIYKIFDASDKNTVISVIEKLIKDNVIVKEKQGNFNLLKVNK